MPADKDVSDWLNLPTGLTAKIRYPVEEDDTTAYIRISGKPSAIPETSGELIRLVVPATALTENSIPVVWGNSSSYKYVITNPTASVSGGPVTGTVGSALPPAVNVTIQLDDADNSFAPLAAGADVASWFINTGKVAGLTYRVDTAVLAGDNSVTVTIGGTPQAASNDDMHIRIPANGTTSGIEINITPPNSGVSYSIN
jgi:hypothetical protein